MALPEGMYRFVPPGQEELQKFISSAANQSVRPYNTNEEYLYAMKEDLAEWFKELYQVDIHVDNFIDFLENGILLCEHANSVNERAHEFRELHRGDPILKKIILPSKSVPYNQGHHASTFFARDNVANFINWCRKELLIAESVMFETNDLVLRKNEKNFILCLLEVARRGSKFGVPAPVLIQMEEEIDEEIEADLREERSDETEDEEEIVEEVVREPPKQKVACDFKSLDEMVQYILGMCTCPTQFPMVKVSEGKYKVGDSKTLIFMRILRNHVMVRVGGGWDTLEHYLDKHDPCRCNRHRVEQKIAARSSLNVRQAADGMNRNSQSGTTTSPRSPDSRKIRPEDWRNIRSQSLPNVDKKLSPSQVSSGRPKTPRHSEVVPQSDGNNNLVECYDIETDACTEHKIAPQTASQPRSRSPAPDRRSKSYSLPNDAGNRRSKPRITVTETDSVDLNQTYPQEGNLRGRKSGSPRQSKSNSSSERANERFVPGRSKTPTPLKSKSATSISKHLEHRRSITPTPTVTSQKRAALSMRSKSPDPDMMLNDGCHDKKRSPRSKAPPSSYRNSETLPRNYRTSTVEKTPAKQNTKSALKSKSSSSIDHKPLPRPSSAMSYSSPNRDSHRKFSSTLSTTKEHHRSMQDIRHSENRPKSALASVSTTNLSTVPTSKRTGRHTIASTNPMQSLSNNARSRSMDNLSIQKQLTASNERNMFFERLSQPKSTPKTRSRSNLLDEDVLFVERKGQGTHILQRDQSPRSGSPTPTRSSRSHDDHPRLARESSTGSDTSTQSTQQQKSITPSDLRLRIRRDDGDKRSRGQWSNTSSNSSSPLKDGPNPGNLRLSVSLTGSPESPVSRVSYSLTPDGAGDEPQSSSSSHSSHTPKIIDRRNPHNDSHLKAPPKRKVSKEEVLHVMRNADGRHVWEHTDTSIDQSQEYIDMSPYKDQLSPRSRGSAVAPHARNNSSSSDSSMGVAARNPANTRVSRAEITLGKPVRTSTPRRPSNQPDPRSTAEERRKIEVASTSSSSIASSKSSFDNNRRRGNALQKTGVTDQIRSMLYTEDGRPKQSASQKRPTTPRASTMPRSSKSSTHKSEPSPRRSQARPTTPRSQVRPTTPRSRPKTPDGRRSTLTRQEKLKDWDGPSKNRNNGEEASQEVYVDKETRMLRAMEKEISENQKVLAASGDSEDAPSGNDSADYSKQAVEYDYNGRRIRKKPVRSKSPSPASNSRKHSSSRMERLSSCDSEATNKSFEAPESLADSEDFEVAMAMSGGPKKSAPSAYRSRSVDDFLDITGSLPRPRKDEKHGSRKSRIPTPVHFGGGRKSVTGVPYHDSNASKSAMKSNVEGVGSHEQHYSPDRNRVNSSSGSSKPKGGTREQRNEEIQRNRAYIEQKENRKPAMRDENGNAEEYDLDGQDYFEYGRYGNKNNNRQSRKQHVPNDVNNNIAVHRQQDLVDGKSMYTNHPQDGSRGNMNYAKNYMGNEVAVPIQHNVYNYNANNNNSNQPPIGHAHPQCQSEQGAEPVPPPRRKNYHRSNLISSPSDMLVPKESTNQIPPHATAPSNQRHRPVASAMLSPGRGQNALPYQTQERNDSGIDVYTDPDSPGSSSAMSMRSAVNGDSIGSKSGSSGLSVFSPDASSHQIQSPPVQAAYQIARTQSSGITTHDVIDTPNGRYFRVSAGYQNPRSHTGYDSPRNDTQRSQAAVSDVVYQRQTPQVTPYKGHGSNAPINTGNVINSHNYTRQGSGSNSVGYQAKQRGTPPRDTQPHSAHSGRSDSSSSYPFSTSTASSTSSSRRTPSSAPEDARQKKHHRHSPIHENAGSQDRAHDGRLTPRRRNFDDFFQDNRKLKQSINNLNTLYAGGSGDSSRGFQLEEPIYTHTPSHMPASSVMSPGQHNLPQYASPPLYQTAQGQNGHQDFSTTGGYDRYTPQQIQYASSPENHQQRQNHSSSAPPPPPRRKSSFRAVEKTKLDNLGANFYTSARKNQPEYGQHPQGNQPHYSTFQFANGLNLQQANDEQEAMYV